MRTCSTCYREISDDEFNGYDDLSQREFGISGMCLDPCQNDTFNDGRCWCGGDHDEWDEDEDDDGDWTTESDRRDME